MVNLWIVPTSPDAWGLVQEHNVYAFSRKGDRDKIQANDKAIFYLIGSNPPVFVGIFDFIGSWEEAKEPFWPSEKAEGRVIYPWRFRLSTLKVGAADARKMSRQLSFIENKQGWSVYLVGSLANFGRPIPECDYQLIFDELTKPPITYQVKPPTRHGMPPPTRVLRRRKIPQLRGPPPSHNELRDMIRDIGLMKRLVAEIEFPINSLRIDVAWHTEVQKMPSYVWEVHIGGNFYEALAKLKHAWDYWRAEPFLVTTEKFEDEARSLLGGTFHEIKPHIRIIHWNDIVKYYRLLTEVTKIEKKLRL